MDAKLSFILGIWIGILLAFTYFKIKNSGRKFGPVKSNINIDADKKTVAMSVEGPLEAVINHLNETIPLLKIPLESGQSKQKIIKKANWIVNADPLLKPDVDYVMDSILYHAISPSVGEKKLDDLIFYVRSKQNEQESQTP